MVLPSVHAQSATLGNPKWLLPAELPRIHATTPLPCLNLGGHGVRRAPVQFSTVPAKNSSPILAFKFLTARRLNVRTLGVVSYVQNP